MNIRSLVKRTHTSDSPSSLITIPISTSSAKNSLPAESTEEASELVQVPTTTLEGVTKFTNEPALEINNSSSIANSQNTTLSSPSTTRAVIYPMNFYATCAIVGANVLLALLFCYLFIRQHKKRKALIKEQNLRQSKHHLHNLDNIFVSQPENLAPTSTNPLQSTSSHTLTPPKFHRNPQKHHMVTIANDIGTGNGDRSYTGIRYPSSIFSDVEVGRPNHYYR